MNGLVDPVSGSNARFVMTMMRHPGEYLHLYEPISETARLGPGVVANEVMGVFG